MGGAMSIPLILLGFLAAAVGLALLIFLFTALFGLTWKILRNVFRFIGAEISDALRLIGSLLSAVLFAPLVVLNIVIGRWSACRHFAGAFWAEIGSAGSALYRLAIGNPARLLGLGQALEGVEQRVPKAMADSPGRDKPARRTGQFDGYAIVGSLQGGGSGSRLYIAEPDEIKRAAFARQGLKDVDRVVIKVFSLKDGSSLPQIVRESRALDAAKKLGLVLEHELTPERFFYVMRYVPGDSLSVVTQRLHAESSAEGLDARRLASALGYAADLLASLDAYHRAGLWHKDVKPDNIIIDHNDHKAHLVDFGLVTPLRSAMTLTTHGTEYFRDPELVRQALRGVKVHQIDGSKFDIYAAGAVLYSVVENSFPAHGGLSQVTKRCPEALRWIIRRAMTDYDRRYTNASEMLADLRVVRNAPDPFKLKPVDLPSVRGGAAPEPEADRAEVDDFEPVAREARRSPFVPPVPPPAPREPAASAGRPDLSIASWWSGRYTVAGAARGRAGAAIPAVPPRPIRPARSLVPADARRPAADQVRDARARARQRRHTAQQRAESRRRARPTYSNTPGAGVVFAGLLGLAVLFAGAVIVGGLVLSGSAPAHRFASVRPAPPPAPMAPLPFVDAEVLVVSDLGLPLSPELRTRVEAGLSVLRGHGVELAGDLVADPDAASVDLVASFRSERGSLPADAEDLPDRARVWLEGRPFDAVLLLHPVAGSPDAIGTVLVGRDVELRGPWDATGEPVLRALGEDGLAVEPPDAFIPPVAPVAPQPPSVTVGPHGQVIQSPAGASVDD